MLTSCYVAWFLISQGLELVHGSGVGDNMKHNNMHIMGIPGEEEIEQGSENLFDEIMTKPWLSHVQGQLVHVSYINVSLSPSTFPPLSLKSINISSAEEGKKKKKKGRKEGREGGRRKKQTEEKQKEKEKRHKCGQGRESQIRWTQGSPHQGIS